MSRKLLWGAVALAAWLILACAPRAAEPEINPLGPNAGCYVCHIRFVREELSRTHLRAAVGCVDCHGVSGGHASNEDVGATLPDITYKRAEINPHCRKCHPRHDVAPERVVARWRERLARRPKAASAPRDAVCTDCHGEHRIARSKQAAAPTTSLMAWRGRAWPQKGTSSSGAALRSWGASLR